MHLDVHEFLTVGHHQKILKLPDQCPLGRTERAWHPRTTASSDHSLIGGGEQEDNKYHKTPLVNTNLYELKE